MKRAFAVLTVLLSTVAIASSRHAPKVFADDSTANYYVQGAKGFYTGYTTAFFKNSTHLNSQCLNDDTVSKIVAITEFMDGTAEMTQMFALINSAMSIWTNL
jgi:hypothetical protein